MFHVASYNIRRGLGTDRRRDLDRNLAVLREIDADIIAVQESDAVLGDHLVALGPATIEAETDHVPVRFGARAQDISWRGNMVLVRRSARILQTNRLSLPSFEEQRGAAVVDLHLDGIDVRVIAMHLGLIGSWRKRQAVHLLEHVKSLESKLPTIMMGDINEWSMAGGCLVHFAEQHKIVAPGRSFHSSLRLAALDRIMHSLDLHLIAAGVHESPLAQVASDHLPIWARLGLIGNSAANPTRDA